MNTPSDDDRAFHPENTPPVSQQLDRDGPHAAEPGALKITAGALIQQAYDSIPAILERMDTQQESSGNDLIFDPKLRKAIERPRHDGEPRRRENGPSDTASPFEVTGTYGDYIGIRIDNRCWRVPIDDGLDQFAEKVWMIDFTCSK